MLACPKCGENGAAVQNHVAGCAITLYACPCGYERKEQAFFFEEGLKTFFGGIDPVETCGKAQAITKTWYLSEPMVSTLDGLGPGTERALGCVIAAGSWLRAAYEKIND